MSRAESTIPVCVDGGVILVPKPRAVVSGEYDAALDELIAPSPAGRLPTECIRRATDNERDCGLYALINLYLVCGLQPPTVEAMHAILAQQYVTDPYNLGTPPELQLLLLAEMQFPRLVSCAWIPPNLTARDCFPPLIDAGCVLVIGYFVRYGKKLLGHSVVTESWDERGVGVICSASPIYDGQLVQWDITNWEPPPAQPNEWAHGNRHIVPWLTQERSPWAGFLDEPNLGIARTFLIIHPALGG